jgi:hypothetical protein
MRNNNQIFNKPKNLMIKNILTLLVITLFFLPTTILGKVATRTVILPYGAYLKYKNAQYKNWAFNSGAYIYFGYGLNHSWEFDANLTEFDIFDSVDYIDEEGQPATVFLNDFKQKELTIVYTNYSVKKIQIRTGFHYILTDDQATDGSYSLILGIKRYVPYFYSLGVNFYSTFYPNTEPSLRVFQISPQGGSYFGDYFSYGSFYIDILAHIINISEEIGWSKQTFITFKPSITYYYKKMTLNGFLWLGEQVYTMRNSGFLLLYYPEKRSGGFGGSFNIQVSKNFSLGVLISKETFKEQFNPLTVEVTTGMINMGFSF